MTRDELVNKYNEIKENRGYKRSFALIESDIMQWFKKVGIDKFTIDGQFDKMNEEVFESREAVASGNIVDINLELADIGIVLIGLCMMNDVDLLDALELAYFKIKDRTGKTENGTFKKDTD